MFKNRSVQVKLVNDKDTTVHHDTKEDLIKYADIASDLGLRLFKGVVVTAAVYLTLDTLRQVTVQNTKFNKN